MCQSFGFSIKNKENKSVLLTENSNNNDQIESTTNSLFSKSNKAKDIKENDNPDTINIESDKELENNDDLFDTLNNININDEGDPLNNDNNSDNEINDNETDNNNENLSNNQLEANKELEFEVDLT